MHKTLALLASATLMGLTLTAHADTYTYTYTNTSDFPAQLTFTVPTLITSAQTIQSAALSSCNDEGHTCKFVILDPSQSIIIFARNSGGSDSYTVPGADFVPGSYSGNGYTFTVVDNNADPASPIAATPEPSSLVLLGTGVLGVFGATRRRFLKA